MDNYLARGKISPLRGPHPSKISPDNKVADRKYVRLLRDAAGPTFRLAKSALGRSRSANPILDFTAHQIPRTNIKHSRAGRRPKARALTIGRLFGILSLQHGNRCGIKCPRARAPECPPASLQFDATTDETP